MGFLDMLIEFSRERQVNRINQKNHGLVAYRPSEIGGFVETDAWSNNTILSGGGETLRSEAITALCVSASNAGVPVILLHQGDQELDHAVRNIYQNTGLYYAAGSGEVLFDPLYGVAPEKIGQMIVDCAPERYHITADGEAYIYALTRFLTARGKSIFLTDMCHCPTSRMPQLVSQAGTKNTLAPYMVQEIQADLAQGQKESRRVMSYFQQLCAESGGLLQITGPKKSYMSLRNAVSQKAVLSLNVVSDQNTLLLRIIAQQLKMLLCEGNSFLVIVDNLSLTKENALQDLCTMKSGGFHCAVSGDDLYAQCGGDEKLFGTLLGGSEKWFVLHHNSGISAELWSQAFSQYMKIDRSYNYGNSYGKGHSTAIHPFGMSFSSHDNSYNGVSYSNRDERVIRAEQIAMLSPRSGFVYTGNPGGGANREIAYIKKFL